MAVGRASRRLGRLWWIVDSCGWDRCDWWWHNYDYRLAR